MFYVDTIERMAGSDTINPHGVEASMRLEYGTLDHLDNKTFLSELQVARECEATEPGFLRTCADSYGYSKDFDQWETRMRKDPLRLVICNTDEAMRNNIVVEFNERSALAGRRVNATGVGSWIEVLGMTDECDLLIIDAANLAESEECLLQRSRSVRDTIEAPVIVQLDGPEVQDILSNVDGIFGYSANSTFGSELSLNARRAVECIEAGRPLD